MKHILSTILGLLIFTFAIAQDETAPEVKEKDKPVRAPFESGLLIDNQTSYIPYPNTLEFVIQHKFGTFEDGKTDLWGIYAPAANIRLGMNYVVYQNVQVGYGISKGSITNSGMIHDFNAKWTILEQTRKNTVPVAVAIYGNIGLDASPDKSFGENYSFTGRLSYFGQVIVGRKFSDALTLQVAGSYSHFNMADITVYNYDQVGVHVSGRFKFSPQGAVIFNYDQPIIIDGISLSTNEGDEPTGNVSVGVEFSTSTHAFQIYAGKFTSMLMQDNMVHHTKPYELKYYGFGFTITRLWSF